tara:strand:+ start:207 stop:410 length:204 start_codon:yes stop_codon:yes gene_type:complete
MKVGDLVELSTYGVKLKILRHALDKVGIVVYIGNPNEHSIFVDWCGGRSRDRLTRKDLRYAKSHTKI